MGGSDLVGPATSVVERKMSTCITHLVKDRALSVFARIVRSGTWKRLCDNLSRFLVTCNSARCQ